MGTKGYYEGIRQSEEEVTASIGGLIMLQEKVADSRSHLENAIGTLNPAPSDLEAGREINDRIAADTSLAIQCLRAYLDAAAQIRET